MKFSYKNNDYELMELCEFNNEDNEKYSFDILALFRVKYCVSINLENVEISKKELNSEEYNSWEIVEEYEFINYFYGASIYENEEAIKIAKEYIEMKGKR